MRTRINTKHFGERWYEVKASVHGSTQLITFFDINDEVTKIEELKQLNDHKNLSLSILSHDLRSPLGSLSCILKLAVSGAFTEDEKNEALKNLLTSVSELQGFVDTALQWTYSNFSEIKPHYNQIDLPALVTSLVNIHKGAYADKQINLNVQVPHSILFSDEGIVNVVMRNLISNAIKFTPKGKEISIRSYCQSIVTVIEVRNTGKEINHEKIEEIFSKTHKSENGTLGEKGFGLGLTLCGQLLKKINGRLEIESQQNENIFKLILPTGINRLNDVAA